MIKIIINLIYIYMIITVGIKMIQQIILLIFLEILGK